MEYLRSPLCAKMDADYLRTTVDTAVDSYGRKRSVRRKKASLLAEPEVAGGTSGEDDPLDDLAAPATGASSADGRPPLAPRTLGARRTAQPAEPDDNSEAASRKRSTRTRDKTRTAS